MIQWAGMAKKAVKARRDEQTRESRTGFRRWVADQLRSGAGALHAIARRTDPPIEAAVHTHAAKTAQVLEAEFAKAEKMRQKKKAAPSAASGQTAVGVIQSAAGGTAVRNWVPTEGLAHCSQPWSGLQHYGYGPYTQSTLFNGMIHPFGTGA